MAGLLVLGETHIVWVGLTDFKKRFLFVSQFYVIIKFNLQ